ncbi:hypothetical protein EDB85DRAFT_1897246 [Lactarius pseudohatsudake]|nr:hypothetical protein EDB85DRAFT_1897246 [Lactarius pseudohatsudake]
MTGLTSLPPELFACILDCVPSIDLQQTTISLLRILSYGRIPNWRRYLFYHIHLKSSDNVWTLDNHLQRTPGDADFIKKFTLATWTVDADAAINVVLMIPEAEWLCLCIDINFTPDHLRRLFHKPMPNLRYLSLRFRPNKSIWRPSMNRPPVSTPGFSMESKTNWALVPVLIHFVMRFLVTVTGYVRINRVRAAQGPLAAS